MTLIPAATQQDGDTAAPDMEAEGLRVVGGNQDNASFTAQPSEDQQILGARDEDLGKFTSEAVMNVLNLSLSEIAVSTNFFEHSIKAGLTGLADNISRSVNYHYDFSPFDGGPLTLINGIEYNKLRAKDKDGDGNDDDDDFYVQGVERREKDRENIEEYREAMSKYSQMSEAEWDSQEFTVGDTKVTGQMFDQLSTYFKKKENQEDTITELMRRYNMSRKEAEEATSKAAELADLSQKLRAGTMTPEEYQRWQTLQKDPNAGKAAKIGSDQASKSGMDLTTSSNNETVMGAKTSSVSRRADITSDQVITTENESILSSLDKPVPVTASGNALKSVSVASALERDSNLTLNGSSLFASAPPVTEIYNEAAADKPVMSQPNKDNAVALAANTVTPQMQAELAV